MLTKSSKSLSRKELLLEYRKLRELFEVQQSELHAKQAQTRQLAQALSEHMNSDRIESTSVLSGDLSPADELAALEKRLQQQFQQEKLDMVVTMKKLHSINIRLVERINRMLQLQQDQQIDRHEAADNKVTRLDPPEPVISIAPAAEDDSHNVLPLAR